MPCETRAALRPLSGQGMLSYIGGRSNDRGRLSVPLPSSGSRKGGLVARIHSYKYKCGYTYTAAYIGTEPGVCALSVSLYLELLSLQLSHRKADGFSAQPSLETQLDAPQHPSAPFPCNEEGCNEFSGALQQAVLLPPSPRPPARSLCTRRRSAVAALLT